MNLPRADAVEIPEEKIVDYLLNPAHPDGAGKAKFFLALGFRPDRWEVFAEALRSLAAGFPVVKDIETRHGVKYIVDGTVQTPLGKTPMVRTVWAIDHGADKPRFVTAYPHEGRDER